MATSETVTCDGCGKTIPPGARALGFYVEEQRVPKLETAPRVARVRRRRLVESKSCEFDLCSVTCMVELPTVISQAFALARKKRGVLKNPR